MLKHHNSSAAKAILVGLLISSPVHAFAIRYVKPGGTGTGTSTWSNASGSIQAMINASAFNDEVWVAQGTYKPGTLATDSFSLTNGVKVRGGFFGTTGTEGDVNARDPNPLTNNTVLSGELSAGVNSNSVVKAISISAPATILEAFTITGGNGGTGGYGAGIYVSAPTSSSNPTIANCRIVANSVGTNGLGGGLYFGFDCAPLIQDSIFDGNSAAAGGAIYADFGSGQFQVERCHFVDNAATHPMNDGGGAIWNGSNFVCTVTHSSFIANFGAGSNGGGGAIVNWNQVSQGGDLRLVNCLFLTNETAFDGAAIWTSTVGRLAMTNCTVGANSALSMGGGLFDPGKVTTLTSCIFWANTDGGMDVEAAQITWDTYSTKVITRCCVEGWTGALDPDGVDNFGTDPKFVDLPNDNLRLLCESSCLDNGDNSAIGGVTTDLDGGVRIVNMVVDRGAYERAICAMAGDLDGNSLVDGRDIRPFKDCVLASSPNCPCADFNLNGIADVADIHLFACRLVTDQACGVTCVGAVRSYLDCNSNGIHDVNDIGGTSEDCNANGIPDECEIEENSPAPGGPWYCTADCAADVNLNGVPDTCEPDCNSNGVPDAWDIVPGLHPDLNANGLPDECEPDCNGNDVPDELDVALHTSADCNADGEPDECTADCNGNGKPDDCDVDPTDPDHNLQTSPDCNDNDWPDECDLAQPPGFGSLDCNANGVPDECDMAACAGDPVCGDCNENGIPDSCDIAAAISEDSNTNGIPDECEGEGMMGGESYSGDEADWEAFHEWGVEQCWGPSCADNGAAQFQRLVDKLQELGLPVQWPPAGP